MSTERVGPSVRSRGRWESLPRPRGLRGAPRSLALAFTLLLVPPLVTGAVVQAADTVTITLPPDQGSLAPGPGMEVTRRACQMCHSTDYVTIQPRGGEAQWRGVVTKMIKVFGAPIPDGEVPEIVEYLTRHYGPDR